MKLFTKAQFERLIANGKAQDGTKDFKPVVKWFTPDANCTWLISEIDPKNQDIAFGLCDLGFGTPELGSISIAEIREVRGALHLPVERDLHFTAEFLLSVYAGAARRKGSITELTGDCEQYLTLKRQSREAELQRKVGAFVEREVGECVTILLTEMVRQHPGLYEHFPQLFFQEDSEGTPIDIYEYWLVSDFLARKLEEHGEGIAMDFFGLTVWGRTTTGQAIAMDAVIRDIYLEHFSTT